MYQNLQLWERTDISQCEVGGIRMDMYSQNYHRRTFLKTKHPIVREREMRLIAVVPKGLVA